MVERLGEGGVFGDVKLVAEGGEDAGRTEVDEAGDLEFFGEVEESEGGLVVANGVLPPVFSQVGIAGQGSASAL